jgi:hypothetical protein
MNFTREVCGHVDLSVDSTSVLEGLLEALRFFIWLISIPKFRRAKRSLRYLKRQPSRQTRTTESHCL